MYCRFVSTVSLTIDGLKISNIALALTRKMTPGIGILLGLIVELVGFGLDFLKATL